MREHYDFSKGRKNPYAAKLKKEGYIISVHYSPEDIAEMNGMAECELLPDETAALEKHHISARQTK